MDFTGKLEELLNKLSRQLDRIDHAVNNQTEKSDKFFTSLIRTGNERLIADGKFIKNFTGAGLDLADSMSLMTEGVRAGITDFSKPLTQYTATAKRLGVGTGRLLDRMAHNTQVLGMNEEASLSLLKSQIGLAATYHRGIEQMVSLQQALRDNTSRIKIQYGTEAAGRFQGLSDKMLAVLGSQFDTKSFLDLMTGQTLNSFKTLGMIGGQSLGSQKTSGEMMDAVIKNAEAVVAIANAFGVKDGLPFMVTLLEKLVGISKDNLFTAEGILSNQKELRDATKGGSGGYKSLVERLDAMQIMPHINKMVGLVYDVLLPYLPPFIEAVTGFLQGVMPTLEKHIADFKIWINGKMSPGALKEMLNGWTGFLAEKFSEIMDKSVGWIKNIDFEGFFAIARGGLVGLYNVLAPVMAGLLPALATIGNALVSILSFAKEWWPAIAIAAGGAAIAKYLGVGGLLGGGVIAAAIAAAYAGNKAGEYFADRHVSWKYPLPEQSRQRNEEAMARPDYLGGENMFNPRIDPSYQRKKEEPFEYGPFKESFDTMTQSLIRIAGSTGISAREDIMRRYNQSSIGPQYKPVFSPLE